MQEPYGNPNAVAPRIPCDVRTVKKWWNFVELAPLYPRVAESARSIWGLSQPTVTPRMFSGVGSQSFFFLVGDIKFLVCLNILLHYSIICQRYTNIVILFYPFRS